MSRLPGLTLTALVLLAGLGCEQQYVEWERRYGGPDDISPVALVRSPDSGFIALAGISDDWTRATAAWPVRLNDECDTIWTRSFGIGRGTVPNDLVVLPDTNFCVSGRTDNPSGNTPFIAVLDRYWGDVCAADTFPELRGSGPCRIEPVGDGTLLVACNTYEPGVCHPSVALQHLTPYGYVYWTKFYVLDTTAWNFADLVRLAGGGYCLVGKNWAMGVSDAGDSLWFRNYRDLGVTDLCAAAPAADSGLFLVGCVYTDSGSKALAVRTTASGEPVWTGRMDQPLGRGIGVLAAPDGGCYVFGEAGRNYDRFGAVARFGPQGAFEWYRQFGGPKYSTLVSGLFTPDGDILMLGMDNGRLALYKMQP